MFGPRIILKALMWSEIDHCAKYMCHSISSEASINGFLYLTRYNTPAVLASSG